MDLQANRIINTFTDSTLDHAEGDQIGVRDPEEYGIHLAPLEKASKLAHWGLSVISEEVTHVFQKKSPPRSMCLNQEIISQERCANLLPRTLKEPGGFVPYTRILKTGWGFVPCVPESTYLILPISSGGIPQRKRGLHPLQLLLHETAGSFAPSVIHWFTGQLLCSAAFIPNSLLCP